MTVSQVLWLYYFISGLPMCTVVKNPFGNAEDAGDIGLIPGSGKSPWMGNGNLLPQYFCLENFMDRGVWWTVVLGVANSHTRLSTGTYPKYHKLRDCVNSPKSFSICQAISVWLSGLTRSNIQVCCLGFPGGSDGKASACNAGDPGSIPGLEWQPTPVLLPGKFHGQRSLVDYSPWGRKESDTTEWLHFFLL